ncbi:MAG: efflux RND transporter periplasmic adaptor subunit [Sulfuritalea sp.]|nr:efflux RND transporter periplasmic adaptor subunit [Sulfuritalea sp.]MDP1983109.1 efflux RND transporter periplasmic adaptor subunit [Sulfuritalea sp.]
MTSTDKELPASPPAGMAPPRRKALLLAIVVAGGILLPAAGYFAWQTWFAAGDPADKVLTAAATRGNLEDTVTATGTLQPKEFVDVGTQVSGQIKKLHVDIGAVVKKGQLLAEIDPSVYQAKVDGDRAQLQNQQAQLADRQAQLVLAELQLKRQQNMTKDDATTAEALQAAEAGRDSALAQVNSVKAQMQQTGSTLRGDEASLGYTKIYAPIAGTVVSQAAKQGQTLNANQQAPIVMRIADLSTMTVQAQVSEADVSKLRVGMEVYFTTLGGDNRRFRSTLRQIPPTPTVVNNVVLYDALFDVENPKQTLMTQMTAQVFFVIASARDAVLVPLPALHPVATTSEGSQRGTRGGRGGQSGGASGSDPRSQFANGRAMVSVVAADGKVTEREVKVGVMNRVSAQIVSGLEPGENVVIGSKVAAPVARAPAANASGSALVPNAARTGGRP